MRSFVRVAVSLFLLSLLLFAFTYLFGPRSLRDSIWDHASPVGQLDNDSTLVTPGQPTTNDTEATQSGTTGPETGDGSK